MHVYLGILLFFTLMNLAYFDLHVLYLKETWKNQTVYIWKYIYFLYDEMEKKVEVLLVEVEVAEHIVDWKTLWACLRYYEMSGLCHKT